MDNAPLVDRIDSLIRFFLYVLIFWLPYSPAVIESSVIICLLLWLLKRGLTAIKHIKFVNNEKTELYGILKGFQPVSSFLNVPIVFFVLACLLSVTSSAFFGQSLHNFFTKTLEWFIIYFLIIEVFKEKKHVTIALTVLLFTAFSTAVDSLVQYYITHKDIFLGHVIAPGGRANAGFKTSNGLGGYLTGLIPCISAGILLGKQKIHYRLIASFILLIMVWSLVVTFSRGAWIGVLFGSVFLLLFALFHEKRLNIYLSLGLFGVVFFFCGTFVLILAYNHDQSFLERYETIHWRLGIWSVSLEMIKDKLFFGHGINTFMRIFQVYRGDSTGPTYAHNCYIQMAAEIGIVGLSCFLWVIAKVFHESLGKIKMNFAKNRNFEALIVGLLSGIFAYLIHSFFDTHFYSLQLSVYLWYMVGVLVAICKISDAPLMSQDFNPSPSEDGGVSAPG